MLRFATVATLSECIQKAVPFALSPLVQWVTGDDPLVEAQAEQHADRVIATLFCKTNEA